MSSAPLLHAVTYQQKNIYMAKGQLFGYQSI